MLSTDRGSSPSCLKVLTMSSWDWAVSIRNCPYPYIHAETRHRSRINAQLMSAGRVMSTMHSWYTVQGGAHSA